MLTMTILTATNLQAQTRASDNKVCFNTKELQTLMHFDPNSDEVMTMLTQKGFEIAYDDDILNDTIDGIILSYKRTSFYNRNNKKSIIKIGKSSNGLSCNLLQMTLYNSGCSITEQILNSGLVRESGSQTYHGRMVYQNKAERYDVLCIEDTSFVNLTMQNADEKESYVSQTLDKNKKDISEAMQKATNLAQQHNFVAAIKLIDSTKKAFPFFQHLISDTEKQVKRNFTNHYLENTNSVLNTNNNLALAIRYCDTILTYNPSDSVVKIRQMLENQSNGKMAAWSDFYPQQYATLLLSVEDIINTGIATNRTLGNPTMTLDFHIKTNTNNLSYGTIKLTPNIKSKRHQAAAQKQSEPLQARLDSLAKSPLIVPVTKNGITIATENTISTTVSWNHSIVTAYDTSTNPLCKALVEDIIDSFFVQYDTARLSYKNNIDTVYTHVRKPTKMEFDFGITEKSYNGSKYTDIQLLEFNTTDFTSWMPSLIIPGLGTKNQGARSYAIDKALPFFVFGAIAVAGFSWEMNGGKNIPRPTLSEGKEDTKIWEYKNFGYIVGGIGAAIAATIYIEDIIEGISYSVRNMRYSKKIRKTLKEGPILIQNEDIKIQ